MVPRNNITKLIVAISAACLLGSGGAAVHTQQLDAAHAQTKFQSASQHHVALLQTGGKVRLQAASASNTAGTLSSEVASLSAAHSVDLVDVTKLTAAGTAADAAVKASDFTIPAIPNVSWGKKNPSVQDETAVLAGASKVLSAQNSAVAGKVKAAKVFNQAAASSLIDAVNTVTASSAAVVAANPNADAGKLTVLTADAKAVVSAVGDKVKFESAVTAYYAAGADVVASQAAYVQAQKAAAVKAAQQVAAAKATAAAKSATVTAPASASTSTPASTPVTYHVNVRIAITADGVQDEAKVQNTINAGGQVAVDYEIENVTDIAAHNYVDSTALKLQVGNIVVFSGAYTGTYRVSNAIYVQKGVMETVLSTLGTPVVMQTCEYVNNQMRLVGLTPVN